MRIVNTNRFIDTRKKELQSYYKDQLLKEVEDITIRDLNNPVVLKTVLELRTYHLPPYFNLQPAVRQFLLSKKFQALEEHPEYNLINSMNMFSYTFPPDICPGCFHKKLHYNGLCADCWIKKTTKEYCTWKKVSKGFTTSVLPTPSKFKEAMLQFCYDTEHPLTDVINMEEVTCAITFARTLRRLAVAEIYKQVEIHQNLDTPKARLLSATLGCVACKTKLDISSIWLDSTPYVDGLCPSCKILYSTAEDYSLIPVAHQEVFYPKCTCCGTTKIPYAIWGLCEDCYLNWQETIDYFALEEQFGLLAGLLISTLPKQPTILMAMFKNRYFKYKAAGFYQDDSVLKKIDTIRPFKYRSLKQLGINVEDV